MLNTLLFSLLSFITGASSPGEPQSAELLFVGDAMQHQGQLDAAKAASADGGYDYSDCFRLIAPTITEADYAVCNLEVPLGGGPDYSGYPCFSAPDSYAEALRDAGFDMFLTANNHCLDRRDKAARRTLTALDRIGVDHIGTYDDAADREKRVPFVKDIKGIKIGFLNYTYGTNGIEPTEGVEVALIDKKRIAEEIKKTREAGAEIITVAIHWGVEYVLLPNRNQEELAQFLIDNGVDLIIGGHPHVIQPMKVVHNEKENKDVLLVYSLGNFISNMKTGDTRGGALVRARITRGADGRARFSGADYDTFLSAKPTGAGTNYQVVPSWMPEKMPAGQKEHWTLFDRSAQRIFDTWNVDVPRKH
ncbi:MAG: CapA family protein [Candidatus Amulumruptor caecigallinarius]|nr:CapA family protein [Candidatus Amulumruptor caecigallinarius]